LLPIVTYLKKDDFFSFVDPRKVISFDPK